MRVETILSPAPLCQLYSNANAPEQAQRRRPSTHMLKSKEVILSYAHRVQHAAELAAAPQGPQDAQGPRSAAPSAQGTQLTLWASIGTGGKWWVLMVAKGTRGIPKPPGKGSAVSGAASEQRGTKLPLGRV